MTVLLGVPDDVASLVDGEVPRPWHKLRAGEDRYLCGRARGVYAGLPPQGGDGGPRVQCPACEVVYLNLLVT